MRYSISVLIRPAEDAEQGDVSNERWYQGEADVPPDAVPSLSFPNEGTITLFPMDAADAGHYTGEAASQGVIDDVHASVLANAASDPNLLDVTAQGEHDTEDADPDNGGLPPLASEETGINAAVHEMLNVPAPVEPDPARHTPAAIAQAEAVPEADAPKSAKKGK